MKFEGNVLSVENKYEVDLSEVSFITMKENWDDGNQHIKLHIGTKEVRLVFRNQNEIDELIKNWKKARN